MKSAKTISTAFNEAKNIIVKVLRLGDKDVQTSRQINSYGIDSNPIKDMIAIHADTGIRGESIIIGYVGKQHIAKIGETRLYSTDEKGNLKATVHLKNDDTLELMGDDNFAVKYNQLEIAFNELKLKFNTHFHPASSGTTSPTASQSTADISQAKNPKIKTN
jgi:hypothetical protein